MIPSLLSRSRCSDSCCGCDRLQFHSPFPELIELILLIAEELHQISLHPLEFSVFPFSGCLHVRYFRFQTGQGGALLINFGEYVLNLRLQIASSLFPFQSVSVTTYERLGLVPVPGIFAYLFFVIGTIHLYFIRSLQIVQFLLKMSKLFF